MPMRHNLPFGIMREREQFVIEQTPWRPWSFDKRGSQPADVDRYQR
jgi:hypothetical protein